MSLTTLNCPHCGGALPDDCRGLYPLHRIHADYLCPHCDTVLAWEKPPIRPAEQRLLVLATLPIMGFGVYALWNAWKGVTLSNHLPWYWQLAFLLSSMLYLLVTVLRYRDPRPWNLVVKRDIREKLWVLEAAELKRRSRPGSRW